MVMHSADQQAASTVRSQVPACVAKTALGSARPPPGQSSDFHSDEVYEKYSPPPVNDKFHSYNVCTMDHMYCTQGVDSSLPCLIHNVLNLM